MTKQHPLDFRIWLGTLAIIGITATAVLPAYAAVSPDDPTADAALQAPEGDPLIERIQQRLIEMGLFKGRATGRVDEALRDSIKVYERLSGRVVTGEPTEDLMDGLEAHGDIQDLLGRLANSRRKSIEQARSALADHPATRDLLQGDTEFRADPTRDPNICFDAPTARCLLEEAELAARTVFKPELRDWALSEVLVAQADAGMAEAARRTAARMTDPRLIMSALRDIAVAQAESGHIDDALAVTDIIPDANRRADGMMAVIDALSRSDEAESANRIAESLDTLIGTLAAGPKVVDLRARLAVAMARLKQSSAASKQLDAAEYAAQNDVTAEERDGAIRSVAGAMADLRMPDRALALLEQTRNDIGRASVLMSAAAAQAEAGDAAAALSTADSISEVRYRAVVLGRIALAQFRQGDADAAQTTLDLALAAVERIRLPFARSFAISRIALALSTMAAENPTGADGYAAAIQTSERIDDARLRAQTLWTIAQSQAKHDQDAAKYAAGLAMKATDDIRSVLSRAWMYADLAEDRAKSGDSEGAWLAFDQGMAATRSIDNDWSRARALARIATTLIILVDQE